MLSGFAGVALVLALGSAPLADEEGADAGTAPPPVGAAPDLPPVGAAVAELLDVSPEMRVAPVEPAAPAAVFAPGPVIDEADPRLPEHDGRVLVVHFWATWCAPCTEELDALSRFYDGPYRGLASRGLELVTVSNDVRRKDLDAFLDRSPPPFPVIVDSLSELNSELALDGIPGTVVIGRDGRVLDRMVGAQDWQSEEFQARLATYLDP